MQIMTEAYKDKIYFLPLTPQKTEGVYARPLSSTERRKATMEAAREAGGDMIVGTYLESVKMLEMSLVDWKGFVDMGGEEVKFSPGIVKTVCETDPDLMAQILGRIKNVARYGEEDDRKN